MEAAFSRSSLPGVFSNGYFYACMYVRVVISVVGWCDDRVADVRAFRCLAVCDEGNKKPRADNNIIADFRFDIENNGRSC